MRLGSDQDNQIFRKRLVEKVQKTNDMMKNLQLNLNEFKTMNVSYDKEVSSIP
jgi:FtsZ-binding cell division protein ZapB